LPPPPSPPPHPPPYPPALPHTCPAGATCISASNGLLLVKDDLKTWTGARDRCVGIGGVLAGIHSQAVDDALEVDINWHSGGSSERFWIGLNDITTEGTLVWEDGRSTTFVRNPLSSQDCSYSWVTDNNGYTTYTSYCSSSSIGPQDCVYKGYYIEPSSLPGVSNNPWDTASPPPPTPTGAPTVSATEPNRVWDDINCDEKYMYVCDMNASPPPPSPPPSPPPPPAAFSVTTAAQLREALSAQVGS